MPRVLLLQYSVNSCIIDMFLVDLRQQQYISYCNSRVAEKRHTVFLTAGIFSLNITLLCTVYSTLLTWRYLNISIKMASSSGCSTQNEQIKVLQSSSIHRVSDHRVLHYNIILRIAEYTLGTCSHFLIDLRYIQRYYSAWYY